MLTDGLRVGSALGAEQMGEVDDGQPAFLECLVCAGHCARHGDCQHEERMYSLGLIQVLRHI